MWRGASAILLLCFLPVDALAGGGEGESELELLGSLSRQQIEQALPDWVAATVEATPDSQAANRLAFTVKDGLEVTVYLGTWCTDSRRELARLWRALDQTGGEPPFSLVYVGVARGLTEPAAEVVGVDLRFVPTFVVRRQGEELGRIVEESPNGVERDLLALVEGERTGTITARTDLDTPPDGR